MAQNLCQIMCCFAVYCAILLTVKFQVTAGSDDIFQYIPGIVPDEFTLGQHYPSRNETEECRPIRVRIERNSNLFHSNLVVNTNSGIDFAVSDARIMTSRLQTRLNHLALSYLEEYGLRITVLRSWVEYSDSDGLDDPYSLHYEGRTVRVQVRADHYSRLLQLAVTAGFDWVFYAAEDFVRMSVIPDVCNANLDMVFMLDQSGSVGLHNHNIALQFLKDVVSFYSISNNSTQVGLITFSSGATVQFQLNEHTDITSLQTALDDVIYKGGWTTTALALLLAHQVLTPSSGYGTRPLTSGVPRIAVLITDGRSNIYSIRNIAPLLRNSGVQVYAVGIGNVYLDELKFIASDPDIDHVFVLNSFNDAPDFVDFLSFTACDTPAIVTPGENTTTEVEEDGFRFFQSECPAFSMTIMIEQIDLVGTCSLYASTSIQNPGPLSPHGVIGNEDHSNKKRSIHLQRSGLNRFIYWSVKGVDPRNLFSVIIWDMIFPEDSYTVTIAEDVVGGTTVFNLNDALRMTNVSFTYSIQSGDDSGLFAVDPATGSIVTAAPLNTNTQFTLVIVAQNANFSCHRGRVIIEVIVTNDRIEFPSLPEASIFENANLGDEVAQVTVAGGDNTVVYSIVNGNVGNVFAIGAENGLIELSGLVNFEDIDMYSLTLQAVETSSGMVATAVQIVNIQDVNELPFFTTECAVLNNCVFNVSEVIANNTPIATIVADDPDRPGTVNGDLVFSIEGNVPFQIIQTGRTAVIATSSNLPDNVFTFSFNLIVRDIDNSISTTIVITVEDVNNNPPVFVNFPLVLKVEESFGSGSFIVRFMALDSDRGTNAQIIYSISSNILLPFSIDPDNGTLTVSGDLDFEDLSFYSFNVTASNPDGLRTSMETSILLIDVNDNRPIFERDVYNGSVVEHSIFGTPVVTVSVSDADSGQNSQFNFSIVSGNFENAFTINAISTGMAIITVSPDANINREEIEVYNLVVMVTDRGSPQLSNTALVMITVTDINDNAPNFLPEIYNVDIREDEEPIFDIVQVYVFDLDELSTPNTQVDFEITDGNIGNVFFIDKIDENTATLQLIGELSFETQPSYTLTLTATDRGTDPGPQSSTAIVNISVQNVITSAPVVVTGNLTINISDSTDVGTPIAVINATDADGDEIMFAIISVETEGVGGNAALGVFSIDENGVVRLAQSLNFAINTQFEVTIEVTDGILRTTTVLIVMVVNGNRFPPTITTLDFSVSEELPAGTIIGTVQATDTDANPSETITFSIIGTGRFFSIESETGILRTTEVLDREMLVLGGLFLPENNSSERITIRATDEGIPTSLSSTTQVTITLLDINDNAPSFITISNSTDAAVTERNMDNPIVLNAAATDPDLGQNGAVSYLLEVINFTSNATPPFVISNDGMIRATMPLDREEREFYSVLIRASDNGTPPLSTVVVVQIRVLDVNDNPPIFSQSVYSINVLETTVPPEVLLQAFAYDIDSGPRSEIDYSILDPPNSNIFSISSVGEVILNGNLDFETMPVHVLIINAQDRGTPPMSATATVNVNVQNVDEIPPFFPITCSQSISESFPPGNPVTNCIAIDRDDTMNNRTTTVTQYELLDGNIGGAFEITNVGTVRLIANLDREVIEFYSIRVRATDQVGLSADTFLNITVLDINDNSPVISNLPGAVTIPVARIQSQIREVFTVIATDADVGQNAELVYSFGPIFQNPQDLVTNITVIVADSGDTSNTITSDLTLNFEEVCALQQYNINSTNGVITSDLLCSVEATPAVMSVNINTDFTLLCPIIRNIPVTYTWTHNGTDVLGPISLSGNTGEFIINSARFQDAGEYRCRVSSAIGNLLSMPAIVSIQVPATITIPPMDARDIEVDRTVSFRCFTAGIPTPIVTWSRVNQDGSLSTLSLSSRIVPTNRFLTIADIQSSDGGNYACTASNSAGVAMANFQLIVFSQSNVVILPLMSFSMPSRVQSCHELNTTQFENVMMDITTVRTLVTSLDGDDLCTQSACSPSPCLNDGSCDLVDNDPTALGYTCSCSIGYTGSNCEADIDECREDPCLSGGSCTNTDGSFSCNCTPGTTGHRCQYTTVCDTQPCPVDQLCITTVANVQGFVCEEQTSDGVVVTLGNANTGMLDDQVNSLREIQQDNAITKRRKRQTADTTVDLDDFVTVCEARFMTSKDGRYLLRWVCPEGVESPTGSDLDDICNMLFTSGLVTSCETPNGLNRTNSVQQVPPTTVLISFILVMDGSPLSGGEAIALLTRTGALDKLRVRGYQAVNFTAAVPFNEPVLSATEGIIVGVAVAITVAVFTAALIFCIVVCVVRRRNSNKKLCVLDNSHSSLHTIYSQDHSPQEETFNSSYVSIDHSSPIQHTFTFTNTHHPHTGSNKPQETIFDDDIYGRHYIPPQPTTKASTVTESIDRETASEPLSNGGTKKRGSSLKRSSAIFQRGRQPSLRRAESQDNLLIDDEGGPDYDTLEPVVMDTLSEGAPRVPSKALHRETRAPAANYQSDEEAVYGNIQHTRLGAHGNAGQRWESYWQTQTLLRSPHPPQPHNPLN